ncbi:hypothetical protein E2C06_14265 [Dankookia rubra]|uniref:Uncharacterized protein n=1 Tax=Dankookia rubra TaxID=1442381 RepID=A0A4R5QFU0_9PROT|nr:hypothetical protein [Dankookia rubra]TDH61906.1 hypothetical protein E2C06_14265 [Dankookia rubra]
MQTHAFADAGFAIPPRPARAGSATVDMRLVARRHFRAAGRWFRGLDAVQEASLIGIVSMVGFWALAELVLSLQGF